MKEINEKSWKIIFRNLSIKDLINCRLVNKKFKNLSDNTDHIDRLVIGEPDLNDDYIWIFNNKLTKDDEIINSKCFRSIISLSIFNLNKCLKYLRIHDPEFKVDEISNLINLESIEFGQTYVLENDLQTINSNNLKVFAMQLELDEKSRLSFRLNTPNLEKIKFHDMNNIQFNFNLESIKHVIVSKYTNALEVFKNLEIMELRRVDLTMNENVLSVFKYLKQLKINRVSINSSERMKNILIKILNDKIGLKRDVKIYLKGIEMKDINKFYEFANERSYWKFMINNYDLLDLNLAFVKHLHYDKFEEFIDIKNDLPPWFFDKYYGINFVKIYEKVKDVDGLIMILKNLKNIRIFAIYSNELFGELFYNYLPNTIKVLYILNSENINYDFILKLTKLTNFNVNVDKDLIDLALKSFLNLKNLTTFSFNFKNQEIVIRKEGKCFYLNNKEILDYDQLVEVCHKIRI